MRRGCIAIGKMQCDGCHRSLGHGERYLMLEGGESNEQRLCVECCLKLGYASYKEEEGEETITFFSREEV
ncbi:MAG: hypothetical protein J7K94_00315 [Dehalococcoidia bacterium]|nr:hypothetical protein [Dehalococcoidia bacterium]